MTIEKVPWLFIAIFVGLSINSAIDQTKDQFTILFSKPTVISNEKIFESENETVETCFRIEEVVSLENAIDWEDYPSRSNWINNRTREINPKISLPKTKRFMTSSRVYLALVSGSEIYFFLDTTKLLHLKLPCKIEQKITKDVFLFSPKIDMMYKKSNVLTKYYW